MEPVVVGEVDIELVPLCSCLDEGEGEQEWSEWRGAQVQVWGEWCEVCRCGVNGAGVQVQVWSEWCRCGVNGAGVG